MHRLAEAVHQWYLMAAVDEYHAAALCALTQVLVFFSSLFGDLIESIMKRDAGMKVRHRLHAHAVQPLRLP